MLYRHLRSALRMELVMWEGSDRQWLTDMRGVKGHPRPCRLISPCCAANLERTGKRENGRIIMNHQRWIERVEACFYILGVFMVLFQVFTPNASRVLLLQI